MFFDAVFPYVFHDAARLSFLGPVGTWALSHERKPVGPRHGKHPRPGGATEVRGTNRNGIVVQVPSDDHSNPPPLRGWWTELTGGGGEGWVVKPPGLIDSERLRKGKDVYSGGPGRTLRCCNQENLIEQLKNGARTMQMQVDNLSSNWAYMVMASLAWSLKAWSALSLPRRTAGVASTSQRSQPYCGWSSRLS